MKREHPEIVGFNPLFQLSREERQEEGEDATRR